MGMETPDGTVCKFDIENGVLKSPDAIFNGGVAYFTDAVADGDRELAARLTRKNMQALPYWQAHPFAALDGATSTDEEFAHAMAKLA